MEDTVLTFTTLNVNIARLRNRLLHIWFAVTVLLTFFATNAAGMPWHGITPLRSTRTQVENILGKPDKLGFYHLENERALIFYSTEPCENRNKCECLVARDTVLQINVTLEHGVKVSRLDLNKMRYTKVKAPYGFQSTYSDLDDGIVYTVNEAERTVTAIDYWPSTKDCGEILVEATQNTPQNVWQGLTPLRSRREDVERLLGPPKDSIDQTYIYETQSERVDVSYSAGACESSQTGRWNVAAGIVVKIRIYPRMPSLVRDLPINLSRYKRVSDPNIPNRFFYINEADGMMIESEVRQACEEVINITYEPTTKDESWRCQQSPKKP